MIVPITERMTPKITKILNSVKPKKNVPMMIAKIALACPK